jgi:hypothetical protein
MMKEIPDDTNQTLAKTESNQNVKDQVVPSGPMV